MAHLEDFQSMLRFVFHEYSQGCKLRFQFSLTFIKKEESRGEEHKKTETPQNLMSIQYLCFVICYCVFRVELLSLSFHTFLE